MDLATILRYPFEDTLWSQWFWPLLFNLLLIATFILLTLATYEQ